MNNIIKILFFFVFFTNCSLNKDSKFWTKSQKIEEIKKEKVFKGTLVKECNRKFVIKKCKEVRRGNIEEIFAKDKIFDSEFNPNLKISLYTKAINKSFFNNNDNNNGRINYQGNLKNISKFKFSKIDNFFQYSPEISFDNENIIFFDNKGTIIKFNDKSKLIWKKNHYSKNEKKQKPILFFANNKKVLIVADNISKYYALNIETGELLWAKNNTSPFNSQIKIHKDKFFVIDYENDLRSFSIKDGKEVWTVKTRNSLMRSQKKLSMVIVDEKIYFNNSLGDITAVNIEDGELLWQIPTQNSLVLDNGFFLKTSDIVADKDTLYFSNNQNEFFSIDINTGSLHWKQKINTHLRPTVIDNYIFSISLEGYLIIIDRVSGNIIRITDVFKNFKPKLIEFSRSKLRSEIKPTGFIVGRNNIYLTTDHGRLLVIDITTGITKNTLKLDNEKILRPSVVNKNFYIIKDNSIIKLN